LSYEPLGMLLSRRLVSLAVCGLAASLPACGGGAALLHPAHTLPLQRVSAGAGLAASFTLAESRSTEGAPGGQPGTPGAPVDELTALEGAAIESALSPGISPWLGARVGLGGSNEAGVTYTGRAVRMDGRHAFTDEALALSVGAGASAVLLESTDDPREGRTGDGLAPRSGELSYGFDVPVLVGWRSSGSVVEAWAGVRGGMEWLNAELALATAGATERAAARVDATRWFGGGVVGMALGLRPISLAVELDVAYQAVTADGAFPRSGAQPARRSTTITGLTLAPAGAIVGKF